jgi:hypothetical protein
MPCACKRCLQHAWTLGLPPKPPSKAAIRKAFRGAAKLWHPDRFESEPLKRHDAEERFKKIQVAYRELWEHSAKPEAPAIERSATQATVRDDSPILFFGDAPHCFVPPHFPSRAQRFIFAHLEGRERVLGFVDLSGAGSSARSFSQYILFTSDRIFVRNALNIVSLVWYTDLGEIRLIDKRKGGKPGIWQKIVENLSRTERRYSLQIHRLNGTPFFSITGQADDTVKKVIYNFLLQKKSQVRS